MCTAAQATSMGPQIARDRWLSLLPQQTAMITVFYITLCPTFSHSSNAGDIRRKTGLWTSPHSTSSCNTERMPTIYLLNAPSSPLVESYWKYVSPHKPPGPRTLFWLRRELSYPPAFPEVGLRYAWPSEAPLAA